MAQNPYVKFGVIHNEILDYIISQSPQNPVDSEQMAGFVSDYYSTNLIPVNNVATNASYYAYLINNYNDFSSLDYNGLKELAISRNGKNPFIRNFIDELFIDYSTYSFDDINTYLENLQSGILSNIDVDNNAKHIPLLVCAIGIKSCEYWKFQIDNHTAWEAFMTSAPPTGYALADFVASVMMILGLSLQENYGYIGNNTIFDYIGMVAGVSYMSAIANLWFN